MEITNNRPKDWSEIEYGYFRDLAEGDKFQASNGSLFIKVQTFDAFNHNAISIETGAKYNFLPNKKVDNNGSINIVIN